jgi:hypothetical protein
VPQWVAMGGNVGVRRRVRGIAVACVAMATLSVAAPWSTAGAATPGLGPALLTAVDVQDLGTVDRVTFHFRSEPGDPLPEIFRAEYISRPVVQNPSGLEIAVAGDAILQIVMSNASGVDLTVDPAVETYTGPTRIPADLPSVIELVETGDFEAVLSWAIGLRSGAATVTAQVLTGPTRVIVDIPHVTTAIVAAPSFTG